MARVYMIYRTHMFGDVIGAVLKNSADIELVGPNKPGVGAAQVAMDIAALQPDVILLEEDGEILRADSLHTLLASPIPSRLITLRLDADGMHVWSQTWHEVVFAQDLVDAVLTARAGKDGEPASPGRLSGTPGETPGGAHA